MKDLLLVCTGNSCRSPLAEVMLRARLLDHPRLAHLHVHSAGTAAWEGAPASEGSFLVALERGLDLSGHRARQLGASLLDEADLILTMGRSHAVEVIALGGAGKVHTLVEYADAPGFPPDVADPIGGDVARYRETAEMLDRLLAKVVDRLEREVTA